MHKNEVEVKEVLQLIDRINSSDEEDPKREEYILMQTKLTDAIRVKGDYKHNLQVLAA